VYGTGYAGDRRQASSHRDITGLEGCDLPVGAASAAKRPVQASTSVCPPYLPTTNLPLNGISLSLPVSAPGPIRPTIPLIQKHMPPKDGGAFNHRCINKNQAR